VEIGLAATLVLQWKPRVALIATLFLFLSFFGVSVYGWRTGMANDCGCFGHLVRSSFGWNMMLRNGVFVALSLFALTAQLSSERSL